MYLNVGEDISDMMLVGGVHTPINNDEGCLNGTNPYVYMYSIIQYIYY